VKSDVSGSFVQLKDIARIELGAENYQSFNTINGYQLQVLVFLYLLVPTQFKHLNLFIRL